MKQTALALALVLGSSLTLMADSPSMEILPSLAPNAYGSPSWNSYVFNAMNALENGLSTVGDSTTDPTAYYQVNSITPNENVVTGFHSWLGQANPTGAFANELGNRLHFGLIIHGNGTEFSLSELSFNMSSSDPNDILGYTGNFDATDNYSVTRVGYIESSHTFVTSGSATQLVDDFFYVGVGNALDVYTSDPGATLQDKIDNALSGGKTWDCGTPCTAPATPYSVTTVYTLKDANGATISSAGATVNVVPEPASAVLLITAAAGVFIIRRRITA